MNTASQITGFASKARRRNFILLLLDQSLIALSIAMAATVALLLLGTQILDWYWPVGLFTGSLAWGAYRVWRRRQSQYSLLQRIDGDLGLHDSLSTAYYFEEISPANRGTPDAIRAQHEQAERVARTLSPSVAVPLRVPPSLYVAIVAVVAAGTVFGVRYGVRQSLDLKPPISRALVEFFRPTEEMAQAWEENRTDPEAAGQQEMAPDRPPRREGPLDEDSDSQLNAAESPEAGDGLPPDSNRTNDEGVDPLESSDEDGDRDGGASDSDAELPEGLEGIPPPESEGGEEAAPPNQDSDLIRKMQDAFAKLMAKMKIPPRAGDGRRTASKKSQQKRQMPGAGDEKTQSQGDGMQTRSPGEESQQMGQQAKAGKGDGPPQRTDQPGEQSARSGMGSKDGEKAIKIAEQEEAMGKLSEILGKRAENIKGDVMVEVSSGNQRLRTEYSESQATHRAAGGEIHRDEVPLVYQEYVQRYFEAVHGEEQARDGGQ